jgi:hypothetical protein
LAAKIKEKMKLLKIIFAQKFSTLNKDKSWLGVEFIGEALALALKRRFNVIKLFMFVIYKYLNKV